MIMRVTVIAIIDLLRDYDEISMNGNQLYDK